MRVFFFIGLLLVGCAHTLDPRAAHVEHSLLPRVIIDGEPTVAATIAERMAALRVPGASVAVIDGGRIAWARGYGVVEPGGAPVTPATLFQAASISKPVAALGVLALAQQHRLSLDADVNTLLRSWKVPGDKIVTLRQILSHSAGLTVHGFAGYEVDAKVPTLAQVLDGTPPANSPPIRVDMTPGQGWRYSGGGYTVLQQLVIDVTGESFESAMEKLVLGPAGMTASSYEQLSPRRAARAASGTHAGAVIRGRWHVYPERAAAGLWSTPTDLARFALDLEARHRVISAEGAARMLTPVMEGNGLGLFIAGAGDDARFLHDGANEGFRAKLVAYVRRGQGAIVMTNGDDGDRLATEIIRAIAAEYHWPGYPVSQRIQVPSLAQELLAALTGTYQIAPGVELVIAMKDGHLIVTGPRGDPHQLYPSSPSHFFVRDMEVTLDFVADGLIFTQDGVTAKAPKL